MSATSRLYLNTNDRSSGSNNDSTWIMTNNQINKFTTYAVQLEHAVIINGVYPTNTTNRDITFFENSNDLNVAIAQVPQGLYTGTTYATAVAAAMTTASAVFLNSYTYTGSYSTTTFKLTISANGANVFRIASTGTTAATQMGLTTFLVGHQNSQTMSSPVSLSGSTYLDILASFPTGAIDSSNWTKQILARVFLTDPYGTFIYWSSDLESSHIVVSNQDLQRISLTLRDDANNDFTLPNTFYCSYVLRLDPVVA
jgi:hypothetical protein